MQTMKYSGIREEELKNKVATDFFKGFDCDKIVGFIDFAVAPAPPAPPQGGRKVPLEGGFRGASFRKTEVITGTSELGYVDIRPLETLPEVATILPKGALYGRSMTSGGEEE
jgi:hypothetical protein